MPFRDRTDAGRCLAEALATHALRSDVTLLALAPGALPIALEAGRALGVSVEYFPVAPVLAPGRPGILLGAAASGGVAVLDEHEVEACGVPREALHTALVRARLDLERHTSAALHDQIEAAARDRVVVLVDEVLSSPVIAEAAMLALQPLQPARVIVAAPAGRLETVARLRSLADEVVCIDVVLTPRSAAECYGASFTGGDAEIARLLADRGRPPASSAASVPAAIDIIRRRALRLAGEPSDFDALLEGIGDARVVLIGEATHGTHEFYRVRALITRRLIEERGFSAVAVEADWPDAYRINRYVRGQGADAEAIDALQDFRRFPTWMWRNADVLDFIGWLRTRNDASPPNRRTGFYGLDLYSLHASMDAVLAYLRKVDPAAADRARARYACFDRFGGDVQAYAAAAATGLGSCEREVVKELTELHRRRADYASRNGRVAPDDYFYAEQNARLVKNAEEYYRTMMRGHVESWNLRDRHMVDTLDELMRYLEQGRSNARVVVWAHNSHLGDARATEMSERGELNVGQLAREKYGAKAVLVGFTTYAGTVTAASEWDGPAHRKHVRPALAGSYERLFHDVRIPRFLLPLRSDLDLASALTEPRLERAIGVLYVPETERASHYFHARLAQQFDFVLHFDETRAVEPLERGVLWEAGDVAETFPSGL
jgi:erythromycin esterase-like protein